MPFVRVTSMEQAPHGELGPVVLDLRVDNAGNPIVYGLVFGAMGRPNGDDYYPFTMHQNGRVDFGTGCGERNDDFNILARNIRPGEYWTYHSAEAGAEYTYQITAVDPLE